MFLNDSVLCVKSFQSYPTLCDPMTAAHEALLSMGFSKEDCWSGLPCLPRGDLPDPGIELESPVSPEMAGGFFNTAPPWKPCRPHCNKVWS